MNNSTDLKDLKLPNFLKPYFWSYDLSLLSLSAHKDIIITSILNLGDTRSVNWLFSIYPKEEIKKMVENPIPGAFYGNKKSQNFWSIFFDVPMRNSVRNIS